MVFVKKTQHVNQVGWGLVHMFIDLNRDDELFDSSQFVFCIICDCGLFSSTEFVSIDL